MTQSFARAPTVGKIMHDMTVARNATMCSSIMTGSRLAQLWTPKFPTDTATHVHVAKYPGSYHNGEARLLTSLWHITYRKHVDCRLRTAEIWCVKVAGLALRAPRSYFGGRRKTAV